MKIPVLFYVYFTTLLLITLTIMATMNMSFGWVFYTMCFGQLMVLVMVYKVLRDQYTTTKTFKHFYEDNPINYRQ
ncbi:hypothetical protein [Lacinutrix salivirga]